MRPWIFMLGGLIVWAAHFSALYGIYSIAHVALGRADHPTALGAAAAATLAAAAADLLMLHAAVRRGGDAFTALLAGGGAAISLIAVIWQGLTALFGGSA